jgi:hypothetical protein
LPSSYVIGRDGVVRYAANGAFDKESFDSLLTPLLAEPRPLSGRAKKSPPPCSEGLIRSALESRLI